MTPESLAQTHSQIIDAKLADLQQMFKTVNIETEKQISQLFNGLEFDDKGTVKKTPKNRRILNTAIGIIKKRTKALRPVVLEQFKQAKDQINGLSTSYIQWLKNE